MAVVTSCKVYRIREEKALHTAGRVLKCKGAGISNFGVGRVSRNTTKVFKVSLEIEGRKKPINIKVKVDGGTKDEQTPLKEGDVLNVVCDICRPRRCNVDDKSHS